MNKIILKKVMILLFVTGIAFPAYSQGAKVIPQLPKAVSNPNYYNALVRAINTPKVAQLRYASKVYTYPGAKSVAELHKYYNGVAGTVVRSYTVEIPSTGEKLQGIIANKNVWAADHNLLVEKGDIILRNKDGVLLVYTKDNPMPAEMKNAWETALGVKRLPFGLSSQGGVVAAEQSAQGIQEAAQGTSRGTLPFVSTVKWEGKNFYDNQEDLANDVIAFGAKGKEYILFGYKGYLYDIPADGITYQGIGQKEPSVLKKGADFIFRPLGKTSGGQLVTAEALRFMTPVK